MENVGYTIPEVSPVISVIFVPAVNVVDKGIQGVIYSKIKNF